MNNTIVGVDLAKYLIQVCVFTNNKVHSNTEMTPPEFPCETNATRELRSNL